MKASLSNSWGDWSRGLLGLVLAFALALTNVQTNLAAPPGVPSHFWGEVHITDGSPAVAVGTTIDAYVPGYAQPAGTTTVISYNGGLVYAMDVNADNSETTAKDGGVPGDTVTFRIGTRVISTGPWNPDLNQNLNFHPPDAALTNNGPVNTGVAVTLNASGSTDWGTDIASYAFDCAGDGTYELGPQAGSSATCTYSQAGTVTAGVRVLDQKGGESTATTTITVTTPPNPPPVVTLAGDSSVNEGAVYTLTFSAVDTDGIAAWSINWGDGQTSSPAASATSATHTYADGPNSYTISVTATDTKGAVSAPKTLAVTVNNVVPTFTISGNASVNEGVSYSLTLTRTGEPGADSINTWSVTWGDGQTSSGIAGTTTSVSHTFADGPASRNVSASVTDDDGTYNTNTLAVSVVNIAPTVNFVGDPYTTKEGTAVTLNATATDVAGDTVTYAWNLGSGFGAPGAAASTSFTPTDDGAKTVTVRACDNETVPACAEDTATVNVTNDPPANVTAGGPYASKASGTPVTLTGTGTCPAVDSPCTYNWDLDNDGQYDDGIGLTVTYTWYAVGTHPVRMQVNDSDAPVTSAAVNVQITNATHTITLYPGWNLVSFNLQPASTAPSALFAGLGTDYDLVYAWDNTHAGGGWLTYSRTAPSVLNTLTVINANMGFWIHITGTANKTLTVTGPAQAASNIPLLTTASGWNLVGYPSSKATNLPAALSSHGGANATLVYSYVANDAADHWKLHDLSAPSSPHDLTQMAPGWGYWVYVTSNNTWHVEYP